MLHEGQSRMNGYEWGRGPHFAGMRGWGRIGELGRKMAGTSSEIRESRGEEEVDQGAAARVADGLDRLMKLMEDEGR